MWAVEKDELTILQTLIGRGADVNRVSSHKLFSRSVAILAASGGKIEALKVLIKAGADLSYRDRRGHNTMQETMEKAKPTVVPSENL